MTPRQQEDAERLDHYMLHEGLISLMNDTKWREARSIIEDIFDSNLRFRTKDVRGAEPPPSGWWGWDFEHHMPRTYNWVEWMEINPVVRLYQQEAAQDYTEAVTKAFRAKNIPFYLVGPVIRIQGYVRTGNPVA